MLTEFQNKVYALCKKVPRGKVTTYKEIGRAIGKRGQIYRAVGVTLKKNCDRNVPCHRVVNSDGSIGEFNRGVKEKIRLLKKEGIKIKNGKVVDFGKKLFKLKK